MYLRNLLVAMMIALPISTCLSEIQPQTIITTAMLLLDTPKRLGGTSPKGFDCSGLIQYLYAQHDINLPRRARDLAHIGTSQTVPIPGDLLLFGTSHVRHVALFIGHGQMLHVSYAKKRVVIAPLDSYWTSRLLDIRRVQSINQTELPRSYNGKKPAIRMLSSSESS